MGNVGVVDRSPLNRLAPAVRHMRKRGIALNSEGVTLFDIDCTAIRHLPQAARAAVETWFWLEKAA